MKKLLFLASALSVLLLASCSNNYEDSEPPAPLMSIPTDGKETFLVIQNQGTRSFVDLKKTSNYSEIVQNYIKTKEEKGENVLIPRDHKDYKVDMSAVKARKSKTPFGMSREVSPQPWTSWETTEIVKDKNNNEKAISQLTKDNFEYSRSNLITHTFYSEVSTGVTGTDYTEDCELRAVGDHCFVWFKSKDSLTNPSQIQLENVANNFDEIYTKETFIFGSNIPVIKTQVQDDIDEAVIPVNSNNKKVHIIVYDLDNDANAHSKAVLMGYFWSLDFYKNNFLATPAANTSNRSNECECIHIDSYMLRENEKEIYSTLGHEFQHLLHFVNKSLNTYDGQRMQYSDTWFNEMMSMVCEDIMLTQLGLPVSAGPQNRLDLFNQTFYAGFTTWFDGDDCLISYANAYAFGAFLLRNYGINCIKDMAQSEYIDELAVLKAVQKYDSSIKNFNQLQELFYEVMLYPTSTTKHTLNKSVTQPYTISGLSNPDVEFICDAINLNSYTTFSANEMNNDMAYILYGGEYLTTYKGPLIFTNKVMNYIGSDLPISLGPRGTVIIYFDGSQENIDIPHDWSPNLKYIAVHK